ncbi:PREDICTED: metabotropic glutamate receptor 1-like [Priapulus caudatus]|uniref:Metabotropic glutamate receptor 1-like n=1 Tax=Priapulus caudatus TaxID=37621 RepID=A0ABM1EEK3_PRICU|nr:PREDICTED: metabotropic glutamate receptor 1-like [Priapulus caudatus]
MHSAATLALATPLPLLLLLLLMLAALPDSAAGSMSSQRKTALIPGEVLIGALFSIHEQPKQKNAYTRTCGPIWEEYGIQRVEATFKTINEINADPTFLPGIKLGVEVRDSCWFTSVALEQSIEFIRDAISTSDDDQKKLSRNETSLCAKPTSKNIAGVVGPGSSTVTIPVQNLLQLFGIPQIGYSATAQTLSDKNVFKYFLRVVPSDEFQAQVMVDIIKHYNWTYVSAVHTEGVYGNGGIEAFKNKARDEGICIATAAKVKSNDDASEFDAVIKALNSTPKARAIACFCEGSTIRGLLESTRRLNMVGYFTFIGSDGWADRDDVIESYEVEAEGGISIRIQSPTVEDFDDYYFSLKPFQNPRNPWWEEFWEQRFNCTFTPTPGVRVCTKNEDLREDYRQDTKMGFVIKAITTMAHGLDNMHRDVCGGRPGLCRDMNPINGTMLLSHLMNVSFSMNGQSVFFNQNGDPPGRYDVLNFQRKANGKYGYRLVGTWDSSGGGLHINDSLMTWAKDPGKKLMESVCSKPCGKGHVKSIQDGGVKCCWTCMPCEPDEFMLDELTCQSCGQGWWPNENLTACVMIRVEYIRWDDTGSIIVVCFACFGMVSTLFTTMIFVQYNNTPVVKATTRELSYIILVGFMLCYACSFILLAKPLQHTCYLTRILPGLAFSMIYGALVTKTNRIARILAGSKKKIMTRKPRFMSATAQMLITLVIVVAEIAILVTMLILEQPDSTLRYPGARRVTLVCNTSTLGVMAPLGFDFFLVAMCTLYAVKTRNVPSNFNEAKFIGFTMYTTCIIWLAFVPIYFGSDMKVITMCLCISLSATVALLLLFAPKVYIMVFRPEKNNRSSFTTTKSVRCHIGTQNTAHSGSSGKPWAYSAERESTEKQDMQYSYMEAKMAERKREEARRPGFIKRWSMTHGSSYDSALASGNKADASRQTRLTHGARAETVNASRKPILQRQPASTAAPPQRDADDAERQHRRFSPRTLSRENSSQTTDELLQFLLPQLRRRLVRTDAQQESSDNDERPLEGADESLRSAAAGVAAVAVCEHAQNSRFNGARSLRGGPMGFLDLGYENELYESPDDDADDDDRSREGASDISPLLDEVSVWSNSSFGGDACDDFDPANGRYSYQPDLNPIMELSSTSIDRSASRAKSKNRRLGGDWSMDTACTTVDSGSVDGLKPSRSEDDLLGCLLDISPYPLPPSLSAPDLPNVRVIDAPSSDTTHDSDGLSNGSAVSSGLLSASYTTPRKNSYEKFQMALRARGIFVNIDQVQSSDV